LDRLETMSLLLDSVEAGSFSAAARLRGLAVASLTRKIGQLERQLGAVLLIRSTRRLTLTDAGRRYVADARRILAQVDEMEREAAGEFVEPTGRLVISAPRMFGRLHVLPVVGDFLREHKGINVHLQLLDSNVDLSAGAADIAVRIGALPDSALVATRLGAMRALLVASPALLQRHGVPKHPRDLAELPAVALDIPLSNLAARDPAGAHARLSVTGAEAAIDAVKAGIGYARLLHYQVADALKAGQLVPILDSFEPAPLPVHALHPPLTQLPLKTRRFLDYASGRLRASLRKIARSGASPTPAS
jgi:DNA-binding transcriptional LysR family regulator